MQRVLRVYAVLALISFLLHLVWERLHIHLYTDYEALEGAMPVYLYATLGDVAYTLFALLLVALFKRHFLWFAKGTESARGREYAVLALLGLCIALFVEYKAALLGRWAYTDAMPLLFGFGLSPLVQMTVLLPLTVCLYVVAERHFSATIQHS